MDEWVRKKVTVTVYTTVSTISKLWTERGWYGTKDAQSKMQI
jgi:hypothetical protein